MFLKKKLRSRNSLLTKADKPCVAPSSCSVTHVVVTLDKHSCQVREGARGGRELKERKSEKKRE